MLKFERFSIFRNYQNTDSIFLRSACPQHIPNNFEKKSKKKWEEDQKEMMRVMLWLRWCGERRRVCPER